VRLLISHNYSRMHSCDYGFLLHDLGMGFWLGIVTTIAWMRKSLIREYLGFGYARMRVKLWVLLG